MIHSCSRRHRRAELGIWLDANARGRGVGTAALALMLRWAFTDLGLERIELTALPENESIARVAANLGFTCEGTLRMRNRERGRRVDLRIWGLLRDEWVESTPAVAGEGHATAKAGSADGRT